MGRSPCCEKVGMKKGPWTPEEDHKLLAYIQQHGHGSWRALPSNAGLQRCGKSCRLRWTNYLRPDIKRGKFSLQEEQTIIQLHALLGNRWSAIATHLPKRTDNEIKNYWNTHLKKKLTKLGIDPITHKPQNDTVSSSSNLAGAQAKSAAALSHMAQWESARLEAEARLARQSKLRRHPPPPPPLLKSWNMSDIDSPTSANPGDVSAAAVNLGGIAMMKEEGLENATSFGSGESEEGSVVSGGFMERFTDLLLNNLAGRSLAGGGGGGEEYYEDNNKNYWNSILNLVNSSSDSPMF